MQDIFERYLSILFQNAGISDTESEILKSKLYINWITKVGSRLKYSSTSEQKEILNEILQKTHENPVDEEKVKELLKRYLELENEQGDEERQEEIRIFSEEAEKIVTQLLDVYLKNASPEKLEKVKKELELIKP
jgi:23S rRNA G2069 N7-methylase RlmK/C1962 C5-methylase RlmI